MKKFKVRMQGLGGYGVGMNEREVVGSFHKVHTNGDLSVFRDTSEILLVVRGEWLEVNITEIPKEPYAKTVEEFINEPIKLGYGNNIDVSAQDGDPVDEILNDIRKRRGY